MTLEDQHTDRKSLRTVTGKTADWEALAKDCVCFANGGQAVADRHSRSGAETLALKKAKGLRETPEAQRRPEISSPT